MIALAFAIHAALGDDVEYIDLDQTNAKPVFQEKST